MEGFGVGRAYTKGRIELFVGDLAGQVRFAADFCKKSGLDATNSPVMLIKRFCARKGAKNASKVF